MRLSHKPAGSGSQRPTLHTSSGHLLWLILPGKPANIQPGDNKTTQAVKELLEHAPVGSNIAADNYFHFLPLLEWTRNAGFNFYGTMRANRIPVRSVRDYLFGVEAKHEWRVMVPANPLTKAQRPCPPLCLGGLEASPLRRQFSSRREE